MAEKSRILILTTAYLPQVGGSELAIKNITDRLPEFNFDLITARFSPAVPANEKIGNVNVYRVGNYLSLFSFLLPKNFLPIAVFLRAHKLIAQHGPYDIIHAYQASQAAGGGWLLKWFYPQIPFLVTVQEGKVLTSQSWLTRFFRYLIFKKADAVTVISNYLAQYVRSQNSRILISVIPNGVDTANYELRITCLTGRQANYELKQKLGIKENDKVIITVSRLVEKNGVTDLIDAIALVKEIILDIKLLIVGDGPLGKSLKFKVKNLKLENNIEFLGEISNESLPKYLSMADVFVRPSLSEGLGTAFLEAMAARLPIIGTPIGGILDFLKDGETGLFCKVTDPKDLAEKIVKILKNEQLREKITKNARKLVAEKYDWNIIAEKFNQIYKNQ